jgi:hypothetical protein
MITALPAGGCDVENVPADQTGVASWAAMLGEFALSFARQELAAWLL